MTSMMARWRCLARTGLLATCLAWTLGVGTAARAQEAADDRSEAFRAVEGPQQEDVPGGPLLVGAYALLWLFLLAYVARLGRLHARAAGELARLQKQLERED